MIHHPFYRQLSLQWTPSGPSLDLLKRERFGSISVSGKLHTYPSPNPAVTLTYLLIIKCWVRGGVGAQFPKN